MLELKGVNTHYGPIHALKDASLSVEKGEIVTLIGANGAGKSTLLMTMCGNPQASSGQIIFEGGVLPGLERGAGGGDRIVQVAFSA